MKITCPICQTDVISSEGNAHDDDNIELQVFAVSNAIWDEGNLIEAESSEGYDSPVEYYECENGHGWYM